MLDDPGHVPAFLVRLWTAPSEYYIELLVDQAI
jgi:hypothetical protein